MYRQEVDPFAAPAPFPFSWPIGPAQPNPFFFPGPTAYQRRLATTIASPQPDWLQADLRAALLMPVPLGARVVSEAEKRALARALAADDLASRSLPELQALLTVALALGRHFLASAPAAPLRRQQMARNGRICEQIGCFRRFWLAYAAGHGRQGMLSFQHALRLPPQVYI